MNDLTFQSYGSQQWRLLRRNLRDGMPIEEAASRSNMSVIEAEGLAELDRRNPPPEAAFALLYDPDAPAAVSPPAKEAIMAKDDDGPKEYQRPDAKKAFEIYDKQIKPKKTQISTLTGDLSQPFDDIKQHAHFPRPVLNFILSLESFDDDAKRDHYLFALSEGLKHRKLFLPRDLVSMANGDAEASIVGTEERDGSEDLATLDEEEDEDDVAAAGDEDEAEEPATGTGAAAIAAMNKASRRGPRSGAVAH